VFNICNGRCQWVGNMGKSSKVKSSLFYRNIQNAQKETAKDIIQSPSQLYLYSITLNYNNKRNFYPVHLLYFRPSLNISKTNKQRCSPSESDMERSN